MSLISRILTTTAFAIAATGASAGDVILTFTMGEKVTTFDLEALQEMPATSFTTSTPWTEGAQEFTGVSLAYFLTSQDVVDGTISATAINDYAVEIPVSDAVEGGPIIAYLVDGNEMSVRDKGPLWVIYPFDSSKDYQSEVTYSRSIWQLDRMGVVTE